MASNNKSGNHLLKFFLFTFLFSWILWLPGVLYTYQLINPSESIKSLIEIFNWIGGIGPSLIAFLLIFKNEGKQGTKNLFKRILKVKLGYWYLIIFLLIPVLLILAHLVNVIVFGATFPITGLMKEPLWIPIVFLIFFILQFGEEFGWRGFALDRLQSKWSAFNSSIILGVLWSVWHLPMFLSIGFPHFEYHLPFGQLFLTLVTTSILITWLQNNCKGSLIPAFVIHAFINLSGEILPLIEKNKETQGDYTPWIIVNILFIFTVVFIVKIWGFKTLIRKTSS
jgi:CAAX protease family protein